MKVIPLTKGFVTTVDDCDYEWMKNQRWCYSKDRAVGWDKKRRKVRLLHRIIMNAPCGAIIDHIDGDPLNNRRSNLRFSNCSLNTANSKPQLNRCSKYKGVSRHRHSGGWRAYIKVNYTYISGGQWEKERDAAIAYDVLALRYFGDFARLNFPEIDKAEHQRIELRLGDPKRVRNAWSRFIGVSFARPKNRWQAYVDSDGKRLWHKTNFTSEMDAAIAREEFIEANGVTAKRNHC